MQGVPGRTVVTGGASGIGRATALLFAQNGSSVAIWDRDEAMAKKAAELIGESTGARVFAFGMDQRTPTEVAAAMAYTMETLGGVDCLIANAGVASMAPFLELDPRQWGLVVDVNLTGTFLVCQSVARHMVSAGSRGTIVVNVSISATHNSVELAHYCSSKAALGMLVRCMASELGLHDIRVNAVAPGIIESNMTTELLADPQTAEMVKSTTPLGRIGSGDEVASVMLFLASDDSRYVTGQSIMVCGGQSVPSIPGYRPVDYALRGNQPGGLE